MKTVTIKGQERKVLGKKESKKLRAQNLVPAVLYGGEETMHFTVSFSEMRQLIYTPGVFLVDIDMDGKIYPAMMQDIQWHPVEEQVLHVDFLMIHENKAIRIDVPVNITGLAKGIKAGGKLKMNMRRLKVKALAKDLPDTIDIDVTKLGIGQSVKVADLSVKGVEFLDNKLNVVVAVVVTRVAQSVEDEEDDEDAGDEEATSETTEAASEE